MILQPVQAGITDHGSLDGLIHDDHVGYLRIDTARGLSQSVKVYVGANAYFVQNGSKIELYVNDTLEASWP